MCPVPFLLYCAVLPCTQCCVVLLQGIKWIKNREAAAGLVIVQQSQPKYIDKVIQCIESGTPLLFENLPIDIDAGERAQH